MYSNMPSKINMFEHNASMNIMKHKASLLKVKSEIKKDFLKIFLVFLSFSLSSSKKIEISFCFNLLPSRNIIKLNTSY